MNIRVRAIICHEDKLLLVKHKDHNGWPYDTWVLPGGKVDEGEFITDAIKREMIEETGIEPEVGRLLYVHQFARNKKADGPEFFFEVLNGYDYINVDLSKTTHGKLEIAEIGFHDPSTIAGVLPEFLASLDATTLPKGTELIIRREGDHING